MNVTKQFGDIAAMYGSLDYTGATVLDVGADFGTTARFFFDRGAARVVASEARPEWIAKLWEMAATERRLLVIPPITADNAAAALLDHDPDIVKVDCEGCEAHLLGVRDDLLSRPRAWVMETHTLALFDAWRVRFAELGYTVTVVGDYPVRPGREKQVKVITATDRRGRREPVRGLITGMGRSGTTWTARTLASAAGLDARHETVPFPHLGKIRHIEVNSMLVWAVGSFMDHPPVTTIHLVRDGRDVVRSACERNPGTPFRKWLWEWTSKNAHMLNEVPAKNRYRIEDLIGDDPSHFERLAGVFGAKVDREAWQAARAKPENAGPGLFPRWQQWPDSLTREFWKVAGEVMEACGYSREDG